MNRIKGSIIAKIMAWLILMVSGVVCVGSCIAMFVMEDFGVFEQTKEKALESEFAEVSDSYATRVLAYYRDGLQSENESYFADKAFRYGIIEAESLDGIDLNSEKSYLARNFSNRVSREELRETPFYLTENSTIWYSDEGFGEYGYFTETFSEQTLYADRICYDVAEGIFYYRAEKKYYPIQNVDLIIIREMEDGTYEMEDYDFAFDNDTRTYRNLSVLEEEIYENYDTGIWASVELPEMDEIWIDEDRKIICAEQPLLEMGSEEMAMLFGKTELTFNQFDGTALDYTKLGSMIFDGIRYLNASELSLIDSRITPKSCFVEVEDAYLDEYYTLHVQPKSEGKNYVVVSYIDTAMIEAEKQVVLNRFGNDSSLLTKLEAVFLENDMDAYVKKAVLIDVLYEMKESVIGLLFGMFVLAVICFVYLLCAAGHRRKTEELVPTFIDKIPLDVLCVAVFFAEGIAASGLIALSYVDSVMIVMQLCIGIGVIMAGMAMMTLLSFAVRVKMGKWWRNTVTYWLFAKSRKVCILLWQNIGVVWKVIAIQLTVFMVGVFLGFCIYGAEEEVVIPMFLANMIVCPILISLVLQFRKLQDGSRLIAEGNLQQKIDTTKMYWEFKKHADNLNRISEGMSHAVDERMKSERFKTELITNVSHDIKTPLTSIINYVDLLEKTDIQDETAREYLEVLERQSARLKKLIEDLIEASKASTGNLSVNMEELEANVFVTQILGEFEEKVAKAGLELLIQKAEEEIPIQADGRHLWRVVDNLMNNICKYAQPGSRVYINLEQTEDRIFLTFKNMSKYPLNITSEELMERFVRGDSSRNTEGNGLGLSIAKSLMELMNGKLTLYVDGDLFKVVLEFPR